MIAHRLQKLRDLMQTLGLQAYLVPSADAHQNEYVPDCWQRRSWISGFTGSAGDVVITLGEAFLWTDGRYALQAEKELDPDLFDIQISGNPNRSLRDWLKQQPGLKLGADPQTLSLEQSQNLEAILKIEGGELHLLQENLVDKIRQDGTSLPKQPFSLLDLEYTGETLHSKLQRLRQTLQDKHISAHALNALDAIAWLFNIRGADIAFNPLGICYAIITREQATIYLAPSQASGEFAQFLAESHVQLAPYESFAEDLKQLSGKVWLDPETATAWMYQQLNTEQVHLEPSPISLWKACKNPTELEGLREAHRKDAIAMIRWIDWFKKHWKSGIDELHAAEELENFRKADPLYQGPSFSTIAGFGPNGAVIHYRANPETNRRIDDQNLFLLDSGGQYLCGTTDITRVFHLGVPTPEQKRHYTLVLKGHLALRNCTFKAGTTGTHLDILARQFLWKEGLDYAHGTGHGVGAFLCVHEGPQRISPGLNSIALSPGMILSNEPGVYLKDQYGIRIENLVYVKSERLSHISHPEIEFLSFEDLTLVPYELKLIDVNLLTPEEIVWINQYHARITKELKGQLDPHLLEFVALQK